MSTASEGPIGIDVVICTYNNAATLDRVLAALGRQVVPPDVAWSVLVVDNNSTDDTVEVFERHRTLGQIPDLTRVREPVQGLTPARLCGVRSTTAPWIAFVDDDCLLAPEWVAQAAVFARAHPDCGGFGGRVILQWESPMSPFVYKFGWAFARQDWGPEPMTVISLSGAGMVLNRAALEQCGWTSGPLLADRVGRKLVSGGDVEIGLRLRSAGWTLWYTPDCELRHVIPASRTSMPYLVAITRGLGASQSYVTGMVSTGSFTAWLRSAVRAAAVAWGDVARKAGRAVLGRSTVAEVVLDASFVTGRWLGIARMLRLRATGRCSFFGRAPIPVTSASD